MEDVSNIFHNDLLPSLGARANQSIKLKKFIISPYDSRYREVAVPEILYVPFETPPANLFIILEERIEMDEGDKKIGRDPIFSAEFMAKSMHNQHFRKYNSCSTFNQTSAKSRGRRRWLGSMFRVARQDECAQDVADWPEIASAGGVLFCGLPLVWIGRVILARGKMTMGAATSGVMRFLRTTD
ncbi:potassium channel KAT2 isoform X1 [Panicum miliaceum]|uniref:Potassium channel KAT2 isoform X1 n=1 Tax=Panicum miliaceum TaxID=4540 RepID=A0A3L6SM43_PANMI|nr:potassium channel KAT2 isoform X1 [Panicum miliaceum]